MCVTSMVGDHYRDMWLPKPWFPQPYMPQPPVIWPDPTQPTMPIVFNQSEVSRAEFDELKRQVLEMKDLLKRAKAYDEKTGQADCEMDEKVDLLRKVAKLVGVELDDVLGHAAAAIR